MERDITYWLANYDFKSYILLKLSLEKKYYMLLFTYNDESEFAHGLEEGNPDPSKSANPAIKMKHDIWKSILQKDAPNFNFSDDSY